MKKTILTLSFILAAYILKAQVLYGTTTGGGNNNGGTICKLVPATNTLTAAFSFDGPDGKNPEYIKLLQASDGKLYGMTSSGGESDIDHGTIFSYDPATSAYTKLIDFEGPNGAFPYGSLVQASDGKLYGMTSKGGNNWAGVIFSYDPATSSYTKLIDFDSTNGIYPHGSLIQASDGKLYGMTNEGGSSGYGVIFSYDPATSTYTKLIDFDGRNGSYPRGSLLQTPDGNLCGMTAGGGGNAYGVIFSYNPATSAYIRLVNFDNANGARPQGSLIQATDGKLYGMTVEGGSNYMGVIFSYDLATSIYTRLKDFDEADGISPFGDLTQASDGKLYGMTYAGGGSNYDGVIFSYGPATATYTKLKDFGGADGVYPFGSLVQASDGKLYGVTEQGGILSEGVIFSYDPAASAFRKLRDFGTNNTGNFINGPLIKDDEQKLYGMTSGGGSYGAGTIFSYDATTAVFSKLIDFDGRNGSYAPGSLTRASDGKLYGMTTHGGSMGYGVIFSYDPATSAYTKLKDFNDIDGAYPYGSLLQATDGKLYGTTYFGGEAGYGVIFSYEPITSTYTKLIDFGYGDGDGANPFGSLIQASDGKLYGTADVIFSYDLATSIYTKLKDFDDEAEGISPTGLTQASDGKLYGMASQGGSNYMGVIFSYDPATSAYRKLVDFDGSNGVNPYGSLLQASDGKLYGMTNGGGSSGYGVAFSYDPATSVYTKLSDFNGDNGRYPLYTSFIEVPSEVQISIADKSVIEGNQDRKFIAIPLTLSEKSPKKIIRVKYTTQNNTATAGSDYVAQSGTLVFLPGLKKTILPIRITGDQTPESNETFSIILSDPVNATIADSTAIVTISDDDVSTSNAEQKNIKTICSISLSPNPAQDKVKVMLTGYSGNVIIQLSSFDGRILQQQKLQAFSAKSAQQQINVGSYANGTYLVTAIDEKGNRQTKRLVVDR